jgi:Domain of unknown function (DUF4082)
MKIKTVLWLLLTINISAIGQTTSFWNDSTAPVIPDVTNDASPLTIGLQFYSDTAGVIVGLRFFKGSFNSGPHVGTLWSGSGTKLAEVVFSNETSSGWQQALFPSPVNISAKTAYVISYYAPEGNYAADPYYSWSTLSAAPLHPLDSSPGVYAYGSRATFPNQSGSSRNYWVDPIFGPGSIDQSIGLNTSSFWTGSSTPASISATNDGASVTLGLQFYTDVPGFITGIRFYKGPSNSGPHVGTIWSNSGAKLAEITFSGETASGWQQANLSSPLSIAANTPYVVSYFAPQGSYSFDQVYQWPLLNAAPLHILNLLPGVYTYGSAPSFPQWSHGSNYWVDAVFAFAASAATIYNGSGYSISGTVTGSPATLTLSGASSQAVTTDGSGNYTFSGLANGSYVVVPSRAGYSFQPTTASVTVSGTSVSGISFAASPTPHSVTLNWNPSPSTSIAGYNVYRSTSSAGPYYKLSPSLVTSSGYVDSSIGSGQTYFYAVTAMSTTNQESSYSNVAIASVPYP